MSSSRTEKDSKNCRACIDVKSFMKKNMSSNNSNEHRCPSNPKETKLPEDCPLDKLGLGRNTWSFLHTMAAYYPEKPTPKQQTDMKSFINLFSWFYPCSHCASDFRDDLKLVEPEVTSNQTLSQYFCELHNRVNTKLGKDEFDCSKVFERWKDGWKDGRCD